jgi:hypothetical protein
MNSAILRLCPDHVPEIRRIEMPALHLGADPMHHARTNLDTPVQQRGDVLQERGRSSVLSQSRPKLLGRRLSLSSLGRAGQSRWSPSSGRTTGGFRLNVRMHS